MRLARRTFLASTIASVVAPAVIRAARADVPQFSLKLHHSFSSVSSAHDKFLAPWARKVEAESGGRIRIEIFPSMQLGGQPAQLFDQARDGIADFVWAVPSNTPGRFPKIELFELPFVPSRRALVSSKAVQDYAQANLSDEFREVHPICFACSDRGVVHTNRPIHTIDEIKDLRLHVQTRLAGEAVEALGATAVPMPATQLPVAIAQHVVDGCVDPWDLVPTLKLSDLLKAHTDFAESSLSTTTLVLAMNKATYDRLPRDLKAVIDGNSGQAAAGMAGAMWDVQAAAAADMVAARGDPITTLLPEAVAHWRKATDPVIEGWLKRMKEQKVDGGKLLAGVRALLTKYADEPEPQPPESAQATQQQQPQSQPQQSQPQQLQPQQPVQAKVDATAAPKVQSPPAAPAKPTSAVAPTSPVATPAAPPAPVAAKPAAAVAPTPTVTTPAAPPAPVAAKPAAATAAATPNVNPAPAVAPPAPVVTPAPAASPPVPIVKPPPAAPPKTLDIPL